MKFLIFVSLLSGCEFADAFDGDIEQAEHCCWAVTYSRVRACLADFVEPNHCKTIDCPGLDRVAVWRSDDGEIANIDPQWCIDYGFPQ